MLELSEKILALLSFKGMGKKRTSDFLDEVYCKRGIFDFNYQDLTKSQINQIKLLISNGFLSASSWDFAMNRSKEVITNSKNQGIHTINFTDRQYPKELAILKKKPLILFVKGNLELLQDDYKVAIIGTRNPSLLAQKMTPRITEKFSNAGFTVVSGLAIGCDSYAQETASVINGKTIAILAHGLDKPIYPKQNQQLAEDILTRGGCLVSEYQIGTDLKPTFLVERDEWQSGMSSGTIAIESSIKGGTRHASQKTLNQGRYLAVLNHLDFLPQNLNQRFDKNDQTIGLNMKLIAEKKAFPIFDEESINIFIQKLVLKSDEIRKASKKIPKLVNEKKTTTNSQSIDEQITLF